MPFIPFPSFDPEAPRSHPLPVLWLRSHARAWTFPASATPGDVDRYRIWLHIVRTNARLSARERELRPSIEFRSCVWLHRFGFFVLRRVAGSAAVRHLARDTRRRARREARQHNEGRE